MLCTICTRIFLPLVGTACHTRCTPAVGILIHNRQRLHLQLHPLLSADQLGAAAATDSYRAFMTSLLKPLAVNPSVERFHDNVHTHTQPV